MEKILILPGFCFRLLMLEMNVSYENIMNSTGKVRQSLMLSNVFHPFFSFSLHYWQLLPKLLLRLDLNWRIYELD